MNKALWKKSIGESQRLLMACTALMFAFHWLRVWITGQLPLEQLKTILKLLPPVWEKLSPVPFDAVATPAGRIAVSYDDPIVLLLVTVWAIARGSDAVSGELGRGTLEMVLAQPVRRLSVLWIHAAVTIVGGALLATAAWGGTVAGLATVSLEQPISARVFVPGALNLFGITFFLAGLTTLASSADRDRWRTIALVGGFYMIEMIIKVVGLLAPGWGWLLYFTYFSAFEPQPLIIYPQRAWAWYVTLPNGTHELAGLGYDAVLFGLGLACYGLASAIFSRRDLPAPL